MYHKVIVPIDGSENSEVVLPYIEELARNFGSELNFISVSAEPERTLGRLLQRHLETLVNEFKTKGLKASGFYTHGNPVEEITKYAQEMSADLIVMATHGHSGFVEWAIGGVAEKVLIRATEPILLIPVKHKEIKPQDNYKFKRILLPVAGSGPSPVALPWAKELARKTNAKLFLLNVILSTSKVVGILNYAISFEKQLIALLRQRAEEYINAISPELRNEGIDFQTDLTMGIPSDAIMDFAEQNSIDLIVMSSRGRTGASRVVLGSVTHQIIHSTKLPVLIVKVRGKH